LKFNAVFFVVVVAANVCYIDIIRKYISFYFVK